ncbi:hypothetical protein F5883DRAFT_35904 [Diaporthe sp. PMI_573]|nr:hypothetical protein F5883DRAFT_35904 [Diaporthaceae sp. PMI_573]
MHTHSPHVRQPACMLLMQDGPEESLASASGLLPCNANMPRPACVPPRVSAHAGTLRIEDRRAPERPASQLAPLIRPKINYTCCSCVQMRKAARVYRVTLQVASQCATGSSQASGRPLPLSQRQSPAKASRRLATDNRNDCLSISACLQLQLWLQLSLLLSLLLLLLLRLRLLLPSFPFVLSYSFTPYLGCWCLNGPKEFVDEHWYQSLVIRYPCRRVRDSTDLARLCSPAHPRLFLRASSDQPRHTTDQIL